LNDLRCYKPTDLRVLYTFCNRFHEEKAEKISSPYNIQVPNRTKYEKNNIKNEKK
jgi:hypothetical protein